MTPTVIILAFFGALIIGLVLGLLGGGGSILTVPVLVYILGIQVGNAISYSLFIVGVTSLVGFSSFARRGHVAYKTALIFGIPSIVTVYAVRGWLLPSIPDHIMQLGRMEITKDILLILLFGALMVAASFSMIKKRKKIRTPINNGFKYISILFQGVVVGLLAGLVGAGGGFLIIPALVLFCGLGMKNAVGTSLLIIAVNSLFGFSADLFHMEIDWTLLLPFTLVSVGGIFLGTFFSAKVPGSKLKPAFGWFTLIMGTYIIVENLMHT